MTQKRGPAGLDPLPRCRHNAALLDGAGEILEPSCGCQYGQARGETSAGAGGGNAEPFETGEGYVGQSEEPTYRIPPHTLEYVPAEKYRELAARLERAMGLLRRYLADDDENDRVKGSRLHTSGLHREAAVLLAEHEREKRP